MKQPIMSPEEKRRDIRSDIQMDVIYKNGSDKFKGLSKNICKGGLFVESTDTLSVGTDVELEFTLPHTTIPMNVNGTVAWVNEKPTLYDNKVGVGMGVRFNWKYHN